MNRIPRDFHFIFGLRPQREPFHLAHYLCLRSCLEVNAPRAIHLHLGEEPFGPWWDRIRPHLQLHAIRHGDTSTRHARYADSEEGRLIERAGWHYAHDADFIRIDLLERLGGVYADIDTLFVEPYPARWFERDFVIGEESAQRGENGILYPSLCNAVMLAAPGAAFVRASGPMMAERFDGRWNTHSCRGLADLWGVMPQALTVLPQRCFYRFGSDAEGLAGLFERDDEDLDGVYSLHLWQHLWWDEWRTDFTTFHAGLLDERYVREAGTTYARLARRFLD